MLLTLMPAALLSSSAFAETDTWDHKRFVDPILAANFYSDGTTVYPGATVGIQGGVQYWQTRNTVPFWTGTARVRGTYTLGAASGKEIRLGNFIGPWFGVVGVQTGPDLFWNQYSYGDIDLDPSLGLAWPLLVPVDLTVITLFGQISPGWYFSDRTPVDWDTQPLPGIGHEMTYSIGGSLDLPGITLSTHYEHRITASGTQRGFGAGIKLLR